MVLERPWSPIQNLAWYWKMHAKRSRGRHGSGKSVLVPTKVGGRTVLQNPCWRLAKVGARRKSQVQLSWHLPCGLDFPGDHDEKRWSGPQVVEGGIGDGDVGIARLWVRDSAGLWWWWKPGLWSAREVHWQRGDRRGRATCIIRLRAMTALNY